MIPDVAARRADGDTETVVTSHIATCDDCRDELALARLLFESRARIPADLSDRVVAARRGRRRSLQRPWWGISAAAVAALALGIGITSRPAAEAPDGAANDLVVESDEDELWLSDDGVLAGAPLFEALSDEALAELLEELSSTTQGGQA